MTWMVPGPGPRVEKRPLLDVGARVFDMDKRGDIEHAELDAPSVITQNRPVMIV